MAKNRKPAAKPVESAAEPDQTKITKKTSSSSSSAAKNPQPPPAPKPQPSSSSSSSSSDEEISGSDSAPKLSPIPAAPVEALQKSNGGARKIKPKPAASGPAKSDDPKKPLFQRVWSEEDEIAILKGMIDFSAKKKADPAFYLDAFLDFIKKDLSADVTRTQLQSKIRNLKRKYQTNIKNEKEGKERAKKPHDQKTYELSKIVWGKKEDEKGPTGNVVKRPRGEDTVESKSLVGVKDDIEKVLPAKRKRAKFVGASTGEKILMPHDGLVGKGKEAEECEKLNREEIDAYLRHLDVKIKQTKLVMDNLKSGGY